jgi:16S rRNA processing protein RimM
MARSDNLLEVGRLGRAHGIRGDLVVILTSDRRERVAVGSQLLAGDQWLTVERSRPQADRWVVHFSGIDDRDAAEALSGRTLHAEPLVDDGSLWVHEMIGANVVEVGGTERGRCRAVIANPASDLLELESGALVPAVFVVSLADGVIVIDPPEGLFDLGAS